MSKLTDNTPDYFSIPVEHVSDTAWLVAAYRMNESNKPGRLFHDSLAPKLIGEKGNAMFNQVPHWIFGEWIMAMRTTMIDRLIAEMIEQGVETVVNLAAGLDTRPYRLALPKDLLWIEADLPGMIRHKNECLKNDLPVCRLQRIEVDLGNEEQRSRFFENFKHLGKTVVLTEGLLCYLKSEEVIQLSQILRANSNLVGWIMDMSTREAFKKFRSYDPINQGANGADNGAQTGKVQFEFVPEEGIHYFEQLGWQVKRFNSFLQYSEILGRAAPQEIANDPARGVFDGFGIGLVTRRD